MGFAPGAEQDIGELSRAVLLLRSNDCFACPGHHSIL